MDAFPTTPLARAHVALLDDHALVSLDGEVDMAAWPALTGARRALGDCSLPVVVDLSGVTFLDCEGLRAVLALSPDPGLLSVRGAGRAVRVLLDAAARRDLLTHRVPDLAAG